MAILGSNVPRLRIMHHFGSSPKTIEAQRTDRDSAGVSLPLLSTTRAGDGSGTSAEQLAADAAFAASLQEAERPARREERRLSPPSPNESVSPKPSTPLRTAKNRIEFE